MKKTLLSLLSFSLLTGSMFAQVSNSDDPMYIQPTNGNAVMPPASAQIRSGHVQGDVAPCGGGPTTLINQSGCFSGWYADSLGSTLLTTSDTLQVNPITSDTVFYAGTAAPGAQTTAPLPPHGSVFSGNIRGYWFTAPVDFTITGLSVPTEASTANQSVAVLKFNSGPPPPFSGTTNDFATLGYWVNDSRDTIPACFSVTAGDVIGIFGWRGNSNSYASAPYNSDIGGNAVTFTRMGMQFDLNTTAPQDVWQEPSGSLSRTNMIYSLGSGSSTFDPVPVIVPYPYNDTINATICSNETYYAGGAQQNTSGTYYDSVLSIYGCDSIAMTNLTVNTAYDTSYVISACDGDSVFLEGAWQTTNGAYYDTLQTVTSCDSLVTNLLTFSSNPTVTLADFDPDTVCTQAGTIAMPAGSPSGGVYSGTGATGNNFDAAGAGVGTHQITYTYTNGNNCSASASVDVYVMDCTGIGEYPMDNITVYPNPANSILHVKMPRDLTQQAEITLFDAAGKEVYKNTTITNLVIDLEDLPKGLYILNVQLGSQMAQFKVARQ